MNVHRFAPSMPSATTRKHAIRPFMADRAGPFHYTVQARRYFFHNRWHGVKDPTCIQPAAGPG